MSPEAPKALRRFADMTARIKELQAEVARLTTQQESSGIITIPRETTEGTVRRDGSTPQNFKKIDREYRKQIESSFGKKGMPKECAICRRSDVKLVFDHCHQTGLYRGHLCRTCNSALGLMSDNSTLFYGAAQYLKAFRAINLWAYERNKPIKIAS